LSYHDFADRRAWLGIPNFADVASNMPFVFVGLAGLWALRPSGRAVFVNRAERWPFVVFFLAVALIGLGSSYYHWAPDNARLVWDRLPIGVALTVLVCTLIAERVSLRLGLALTAPATLVGLASVWYWHWSAAHATENLTPYLILQGYSAAMVLVLATLFPPRYTRGRMLLGVAGWYLLGKLCELGDGVIYAVGGLLSGHTLKHLFSAVAVYWVLRMLVERRPQV
jgi:hypothetical protein